MLMRVLLTGRSVVRVLFGAAVVLGCAPRPETTVVHLAEPSPVPPPPPAEPEPELEPPPPAAAPNRVPDDDGAPDPHGTADRARELFEEGAEAYAQGDFPKAR